MKLLSLVAHTLRQYGWQIHLTLLTGYLLAIGLSGLILDKTTANIPDPYGFLSSCGRHFVIFGLVIGLACFASRATRDDLLLRRHGNIKPIALGICYSVALRLATLIFLAVVTIILVTTGLMTFASLKNFIMAHRPDFTNLNVAAMQNDPVYYWLVVILVPLGAGLTEELWRSASLAGLKRLWPNYFSTRTGQAWAVIVCAILFSFGHTWEGLIGVVMTFFIGVGLGLIMIFHRSVWPAVVAHTVLDATTLALMPSVMAHHLSKTPS